MFFSLELDYCIFISLKGSSINYVIADRGEGGGVSPQKITVLQSGGGGVWPNDYSITYYRGGLAKSYSFSVRPSPKSIASYIANAYTMCTMR